MFPFILLAPGLKLLVQKGNGEIGYMLHKKSGKIRSWWSVRSASLQVISG